MAITFVNSTTSTGSGTINVPSGVQNGDLLLCFYIDNKSQGDIHPTGWTELFTLATTLPGMSVAYRVASSEPANYQFNNLGVIPFGAMLAYRGVSVATPIDASTPHDGQSSTSIVADALSGLSTSSDMLISAFGYTETLSSGPGSETNRINQGVVGGTNYALWIGELQLSANSSAAQTLVQSPSDFGLAVSIALLPAAPAATSDTYRLPLQAVRGNDPWQAAPQLLHQHNVVYHAANPVPYDQQMRPIPAVQAGMAPWQAPHIHQHNVVWRAANPIPYDQQLHPVPAIQAGMRAWWAPVAQARTTVVLFSSARAVDSPSSQLPISAIQQAWWAPVPALQATITPFSPANPIPYDQQLFPPPGWQAGMAGWWAPVPALHPTTTPFHGATENDARPSQLPLAAIVQNQPWVAPIIQMRYTIAPFKAANPPEFTAYKIPIAAIEQNWWAPIIAARSSPTVPSGAAPGVGADPIVVWRHRAGMQ